MSDFGEWKQEYELELTNFEVRTMFRGMIKNGLWVLHQIIMIL